VWKKAKGDPTFPLGKFWSIQNKGRRVAMAEDTKNLPCLSSPTWETLEDWARVRIQVELQRILEEEVTQFLGRAPYGRSIGVDTPSGYRNGYGKPRRVSLSCGTVEVRRPRVRGLEARFESRILPLFCRRTRQVGELLPELYLHGLSLGDFELALRGLLGEGAPLSPSSINRLRAKWEAEYETWRLRRLDEKSLVYAWADGIYVKAGLDKDKAALLVVIGAFTDGRKEVLALTPGYRESAESWGQVLRDLRDRGLKAPLLLVADGNLGIWAAAAAVWPQTDQQRCWNHKILNVLSGLPKHVQAQARSLLVQIPYAPARQEAQKLRDRFAARFEKGYPQAVATLKRDWDRMVTFYDFPEAHWKHLRTSNVVESPFASVRLRTDAAKRYKKVAGATALIWRVLAVAEKHFRRLDAPHLLAALYAGQKYQDGKPIDVRKVMVA
jgi:transposase-like protein